MAAPIIQLKENSAKMKVFWDYITSLGYASYNVYYDVNSDMSTEIAFANTHNRPDGLYSTKQVLFSFNRSDIGMLGDKAFYIRIKGVDAAGVEDTSNPSPTKYIPSTHFSVTSGQTVETIHLSSGVLTAAYVFSEAVLVSDFEQAIVNVEYTKGDETSMEFKFQFSQDANDWYDATYEVLGNPTMVVSKEYQLSTTVNSRIVIPVNDFYMRSAVKATAGTPTGTASLDLVLGQTKKYIGHNE